MPIQQFPAPLIPPIIQDKALLTPTLQSASSAMAQKNYPTALAQFRAVMHYAENAFLQNEEIAGDIEKIWWQILSLAINARHYEIALMVSRKLYINALNQQQPDTKKILFGSNWLQVLIKLNRGQQAKLLAKDLLQYLSNQEPSANQQSQTKWIYMQLADLAMKENDFATAIAIMKKIDEKKLSPPDVNNFWRIYSFACLKFGDYQTGFHYYEYRAMMADPAYPYFPDNPLHEKNKKWLGQATDNLLITAEQGLGDALQFVRFLPAIKPYVKKIIFELQPPLISLLQQSPVCHGVVLMPFGTQPSQQIDHWCFLNSLPFLLQEKISPPYNEMAMQPFYQPPQPYLKIQKKDFFANMPSVIQRKKYKIGLVWATSVGGPSGEARTMRLIDFAPLLADEKIVKSVDFYAMQLGSAQQEITAQGFSGIIHDLSPAMKNFADSASIIESLDLLITVDTAVVHIAGGLGKKTFVLIPLKHDWRWDKLTKKNWHGIKNATSSFWYPESHVVFCQTADGDWSEVMVAVKSCLLNFLNKHSQKNT